MKKGLIIGGGGAIIAIIVIAIVLIPNLGSKKIVCKSNEGNITIRYNDKTIVGYSATKLAYDMEGQKTIANKIGIDAYIEEFKTWFKTNTTGTCK